jgi:hypothetical protein
MRAKNEVTVDRMELKRAVAWTKRGKAAEKDKTFFVFEDGAFTVVAPMATTPIKSVGHWEDAVALPALALKRLINRIDADKEVRLHYCDGWLIIGNNKISGSTTPVNSVPYSS